MKQFVLLFLIVGLAGCAAAPTATPVPTIVPTALPTLPLPTSTPSPTATASPVIPTFTPEPIGTSEPTQQPALEPTAVAPTAPSETSSDPVLVGAGDIAVCGATGDEATAQILDRIPGTVFTLGDNVSYNGAPEEFQTCFEESWGRHKARIRPVIGNHEYNTEGASGYFGYFGASAGDPAQGYYSYDLGAWHVVVLNSELDTALDAPQTQWLREDLAAHPTLCTVAMVHRPLFSSGPHGHDGTGEKMRLLWQVLYENNVELVLSGHDHNYERFAPQNPQGELDPARGIRQFVVGTGGAVPVPLGDNQPHSERRMVGPYGVLKLTLHESSYDWDFVSIAPLLFGDRGTGECH